MFVKIVRNFRIFDDPPDGARDFFLVAEMPSISSHGSSSRRSSTPQVKAPCDPPALEGKIDEGGIAGDRVCSLFHERSTARKTCGEAVTPDISPRLQKGNRWMEDAESYVRRPSFG